ncbi:DUF742 domain-containing protein [Streptomyces sp. NPDC059118]|uniref:DUF742 domain-containing protein n=1 Tax=unclassified Streptomyces TaxID=2593676 RepID=UPI0036863141
MGPGEVWLREESAQVRPYGLTGGRTQPAHPLPLSSVLAAPAGAASSRADLVRESEMVLRLCTDLPRTVAEIIGVLRLSEVPVQVVKVLLSDLIDSGDLELTAGVAGDGTSAHLLGRVLHGLKKKWPEARAQGSGGGCAAA